MFQNNSKLVGLGLLALVGCGLVGSAQIITPPTPVLGGAACTGDFCAATAPLSGALGGTGVANTSKTLTLGANLATTGAGVATLAFGASTQTYTFPTTTATLARTDTGQTFTGTNVFGVTQATSLALGGATIGTDALAVTGTVSISGAITQAGSAVNNRFPVNSTFGTASGAWVLSGGGLSVASIGATTSGVVGSGLQVRNDGAFSFSTTGAPNAAGQTYLTSPTAAVFQLGITDVDTAPVAQTLRSQGALAGGTSNVAGANWTFIASPGKGTGAGGSFIFQTTPAGSSGTVVGTPTTALTINSAQVSTFANQVVAGGFFVTGASSSTNAATLGYDTGGLQMGSTAQARWTSGNSSGVVPDLILSRNAAGVLQIGTSTANALGSLLLTNITASGQIVAANMTQTSSPQSGTVCFAAAGLTYDATLGCLASLPELKNFHGKISNASAALDKITPMWASWRTDTPEWKGGDHETQPVFNAREVAAVDKRLVSYGKDGKLRGVRYMEMAAYEWAVAKEQQKEIVTLKANGAVLISTSATKDELKKAVLQMGGAYHRLEAANDNLARRVAKLERRK